MSTKFVSLEKIFDYFFEKREFSDRHYLQKSYKSQIKGVKNHHLLAIRKNR